MFASWWSTGPSLSVNATEPNLSSISHGNELEVSRSKPTPSLLPDCQLHDLPDPPQSLDDRQNGPPDPDKPLSNVSDEFASQSLRNVPYKPKRTQGTKTKDSKYYEECVLSFFCSNPSVNAY
jgi:hypothetical protein